MGVEKMKINFQHYILNNNSLDIGTKYFLIKYYVVLYWVW